MISLFDYNDLYRGHSSIGPRIAASSAFAGLRGVDRWRPPFEVRHAHHSFVEVPPEDIGIPRSLW